MGLSRCRALWIRLAYSGALLSILKSTLRMLLIQAWLELCWFILPMDSALRMSHCKLLDDLSTNSLTFHSKSHNDSRRSIENINMTVEQGNIWFSVSQDILCFHSYVLSSFLSFYLDFYNSRLSLVKISYICLVVGQSEGGHILCQTFYADTMLLYILYFMWEHFALHKWNIWQGNNGRYGINDTYNSTTKNR